MLLTLLLTSIISTTNATADSGGNSVESGGTVVTGVESASVEVTNTVSSSGQDSNNETTVTSEITKEVNGVVTHEVTTSAASPGEPVLVKVEAKTGPTDVNATTSVTATTSVAASSTKNTVSNYPEYPKPLLVVAVENVSRLVAKLFDFLGFSVN